MRDFISAFNKEYQATILLTSHYMADVNKLCRRVIVINKGKILYDGLLHKLVQKYAGYKVVRANFRQAVSRRKIEQLGEIKSWQDTVVTLHVKKETYRHAAIVLLEKYKVADLNIEEPELEDVISLIFTGG